MDAIKTLTNQFRGINLHLNRALQNDSAWESVHYQHIPDLARILQRELLHMGYSVNSEASLQIRRSDHDVLWRPRADGLIREAPSPRDTASSPRSGIVTADAIMLLIFRSIKVKALNSI
ncbi:MAG: hypothetical protein SGI73_07970 [Chloroflexota bacterium]|nr:hypothetical protein [Chloroflexota bacterium]